MPDHQHQALALGNFDQLLGRVGNHLGLERVDLGLQGHPVDPAVLDLVKRLQDRRIALTLTPEKQQEIAKALAPYGGQITRWFVAEVGSIGLVVVQFLLTVAISALMYASGETAAAAVRRFGVAGFVTAGIRSRSAAGGTPLIFPLLEISPAADPGPLATAAARLGDYSLAVFVSPNAADHALPVLARPQMETTPRVSRGNASRYRTPLGYP